MKIRVYINAYVVKREGSEYALPPCYTNVPNCADPKCPQFNPDNCDVTKFFECAQGTPYLFQCANGTVWTQAIGIIDDLECVFPPPKPTCYQPLPDCSNCNDGVFFADPCDCSGYYQCDHEEPVHFCCPTGTLWDETLPGCNYAYLVSCGARYCNPLQ